MSSYEICPHTKLRVFNEKAVAKQSARQMSRSRQYEGKFRVFKCKGCRTYHIRRK